MNDTFWKAVSRAGSILAAIGILAYAWRLGKWQEAIEQRVATSERRHIEHHESKSDHMPYDEKVEKFVLRQEWQAALLNRDQQLLDIKESAKRTEDRVEKIYDILRQP